MSSSEPDEHEAFAESRVSQYVFCPTKDTFFNTLDLHADTGDKDVKLPLVIVGNDGSGKSALLANWVAKRREHLHRDEFLFQHFVGCTTPSLHLSHTLHRLETKLKEFYQLREMKVPDSEEDLRWSLGRFLQNAAKKHNPARVVIIIDGVNRLVSEGMPDGALHWLPTELPPCVRFILSTVELDRVPRGTAEVSTHRSYVELTRRHCPLLRIEPLNQQIRQNVINSFLDMNKKTLSLSEAQVFKIISAPVTSQPMYLRSLLQAVCMSLKLTNSSIDQLLETFLRCSTAHELVDKNLNICNQAVFPNVDSPEAPVEDKAKMELLGKIFTIVYISRTGLTVEEIWGVIKMVTSVSIDETVQKLLMEILTAFTMEVKGMYSFSHELYREVVYEKYICSRDNLIRWHQLMARYFSQLPTGARKLVALPYHLEVSGSWSKVKNCLTDINMFELWWTKEFKADFIKTWAQLTKVNTKPIEPYGTSKKDHDAAGNSKREASRPTYDIVEEYVKSLDEYRSKEHPSEERIATIILLIADFLLEFATLGHEVSADVPAIVHPIIPSEDLKALGVPHVTLDDAGRSVLWYPEVYPQLGGVILSDDTAQQDDMPQHGGVSKAIDDIPFCTTYFFHRWMWIQFPYIALGNCNNRFVEGMDLKKNAYSNRYTTASSNAMTAKAEGTMESIKEDSSVKTGTGGLNMKMFKLPEITFNRKAARSIRRVPAEGDDGADKFAQRMQALQDDVQNYREEYDFVMQMKAGLRKRLAELSGSLETLKRSAESVHQFDDAMAVAVKRDVVAANKFESVQLLNKNLKLLNMMCDRHPANVPALILEVEAKIEQDRFLLAEIKKRLWEQKFEHQMHMSNFKVMKFLTKKGENMHNELLDYRIKMKLDLKKQADAYEKMNKAKDARKSKKKSRKEKISSSLDSSVSEEGDTGFSGNGSSNEQTWDEMWSIITSRTGITEPGVFFDRLRNGSGLTEQIESLKKQAEVRLEQNKRDAEIVADELENARLATMNGVSEESDKSKKQELGTGEKYLRTIKEKAETQEQLEQTVISGLGHLGELLGVPFQDEDTPVSDLLRDIETMVDTVMDEREKQLQQAQSNNNNSTFDASTTSKMRETAPSSPEMTNRPPELDMVLSRFESPKLRLPPKLPSRPSLDPTTNAELERDGEEDDDEEGMWDRQYAMSQSMRFLKMKKAKDHKGGPGMDAAGAATAGATAEVKK